MTSARRPGIRWWPLAAIVVTAAVAIVAVRASGGEDRQATNLTTAAIALLALALTAVWWLALSRAPARLRLAAVGVAALIAGAFVATVRVRGVDGDLVPILEGRWQQAAAPEAFEPAPFVPGALPGLAAFPQFFGPHRNGRLDGPQLATDWNTDPPRQLWRRPVGAGWSGFAVADARAVTQEQRGDDEVVVCYDMTRGNELWVHRDRARYDSPVGGLGPRATPTIDGDLVFAQGSTGILNCLDLRTGARRWSKNVLDENGAGIPEWGLAASPLIVGERVVTNAGRLVAYDKISGAPAWAEGTDSAQYSSPLLATLADLPQVVIFNTMVAGHDARDGRVLWTHPWKTDHVHVALPVVVDANRVLVSSGYGNGSQLLQVTKDAQGTFRAETLWRSLAMKAKFSNVIAHDGCVYGLDDGILACVDLTDGKRKWKQGRYGHGQMLLVGGLLLVTTESGEIVLCEPSPDEPRELTRFRAFSGKTWNPPALAGAYLLLRTDVEAVCYRLPVRGA